MKTIVAFLLAGMTIVACTPAAPAPVGGYAGVCGHLAALGCPEGANPSCATLIGKVRDASLGDLKPACLLAAGTVKAVQACGTVACAVPAAKKK